MRKCKKGLHEMTEENSKLDSRGRKHCRACIRERKSGYHKGSQGVGRHSEGTFNAYRTAMDEALEANPPVIGWRRKSNGILVHTYINDPHAEKDIEPRRPYGQKRSAVFPVACVNGHEFDSWNTMVSADGMPPCRACASPQDTQLLSAARTDI